MNTQLLEHFKIWGTLGVAQMTASISSANELASIFALLCGGVASSSHRLVAHLQEIIMTPELLAMLGGGVSGFVMKMIAAQADNQARLFERMIARQTIADESADKAAARGGVYMRRAITAAVIFAIVIAPFVFAFTDIGVSIQSESKGFLGLFKRLEWSTVQGFVILPEIRQTALAIVGFYFGSSQVK